MKTYTSKIDLWLVWVIVISFLTPLLFVLADPSALWPTVIICGGSLAFIVWLFWATKYQIDDTQLIVRAGIYNIHIARESIISITASRSLLASPALSLDRLEVRYGEGRSVLISPKDKSGFLSDIGFPKTA